jgi:dimethylamine/trimethylamine dehydrogenase
VAADSPYDILFEPIRIGPKVMRNRFYQTPHADGFGAQFPGSEAYFRGLKAEGGWAVVNTGHTMIAPEYDHTGHEIVSRIWDEADVRNWSLTCDKIHEHGSLAGIELAASGSGVTGFDTRLPGGGVWQAADDCLWMGAAYAMELEDIRRLQESYVAAARRARAAGFDIINVHGAQVWGIPTMFLMKHYNRRTDCYGGSFRNRARFWLETLELVRDAVGDDCAITARFCIDTLQNTDAGIRVNEEGIGFIALADHLVDFWDLQVGGEDRNNWAKDVGPSRFYKEGFQDEWLASARRHTAKPMVGVGRFTSPDTMVEAIRSGRLDVIGAARASISDPFLPNKIAEGRIEAIRECIGCNVCVSRVNAASRIICTQNATTGEEYRRGWHPEHFAPMKGGERNLLVVGAGPAGLECAIVLARRGATRVHLVEAHERIGGHFDWVPRLPGLAEWSRVVHYRQAAAASLRNLAIITRKPLTADDVMDYGADTVILATGSYWATDGLNAMTQGPLPGADAGLPHVLTPEQVMVEGKDIKGERVVVYDTEGYFVGVSLAERLARAGRDVTLITPFTSAGPYLEYTGESQLLLPLLAELGVVICTGHVLSEVAPNGCAGYLRHVPSQRAEWNCDAVVLTTQRLPRDELYRELCAKRELWREEGLQAVYRIGDCLAPRPQVADAIFDGHRLGRELETDDPMRPLPWISENRYLGRTDRDYDAVVADPAMPLDSSRPHSAEAGLPAVDPP